MAIKIMTDSASDLPRDIAEKLDVKVLPLIVYVDGKEYLDCETMFPDEFYKKMLDGSDVKTAQVPLNTFVDYFETIADTNDEYIYLAFSSGLSGTYQSAVLAAEAVKEGHPNFSIDIIDTKCASLGLGLLVIETAEMALKGANREELLDHVEKNMTRIEHLFTVDDLEYLFRGGRVSRSQAALGNILNIKPILNVQDGLLIPIDKVKGKKKRLQKMFDYIEAHSEKLDQQLVGIAHTLNEEDLQIFKEHFETVYGTSRFVTNQLGCVIGAHCGPGLVTVFFKNKVD